jgi:RNA polymerase sigma factor (sigma-70 family)
LTARSSGGEGLEIEPISDQDLDAEFMSLRPRLVRFAASLTRSKSDAEDVVQEVWLRWRRHRHTVASPPAWLRAVTRRVVLDMRATPAGSTAVDVETLAAPSDLAPPRVEAETDILPALEVVLALLSPLERAVFVLRQGLEWSNADIARLLGRAGRDTIRRVTGHPLGRCRRLRQCQRRSRHCCAAGRSCARFGLSQAEISTSRTRSFT